jgi:hypothetical protein
MSLRCASLYTFSNVYPVPCLPYGTVRRKLVPYGESWYRMVPYGESWCGTVPCRTVEADVIEVWVTIPSDVRCVGS